MAARASGRPFSGGQRRCRRRGGRRGGGAAAGAAAGSAAGSACAGCVPPAFAWASGCAAVPSGRSSRSSSLAMPSLRPLLVPKELPATFLRLASANTARNIETCGILVGSIVKGELRCDRILVPRQEGTPDTCTTTHEDEIWDYCAGHDVCTFGWIHTHPSQTCFLSSVDLHTHCGYQSMLDEAVAIVLSPGRTPSQGAFRLSHPHPPGLSQVQRCRKKGFHPDHQANGQMPGNGVYEECEHLTWDDRPLQVIDLRR